MKNYEEKMDFIEKEEKFNVIPSGYNDVFIFVPDAYQIIRISEGTGDNLIYEEIEEGYIDYLNYEQYDLEDGMPEFDGGMIMLKELVREKYQCLADTIPDVLEFAYGNRSLEYKILIRGKNERI